MQVMRFVDRLVVALVHGAGAIAAMLLLGGAVSIVIGIAARLLGFPLAWPTDIVPHLLLLSVMLAAAETFRRGEHIAVDLLIDRTSGMTRRVIAIWASATVVILAVLLVYQGYQMVAFSRMTGIRTHDRLDLPVWWVQCFVPVGGGLLLLVSIRAILAALAGRELDPELHGSSGHDVERELDGGRI